MVERKEKSDGWIHGVDGFTDGPGNDDEWMNGWIGLEFHNILLQNRKQSRERARTRESSTG